MSAQWLNRPSPGIPRTADGKPNLAAPPPRTADGKPDLSGIWNSRTSVAGYKAEDAKPWVQTLVQKRTQDFGKDNPGFQCLAQGPGYSTALVLAKQIFQTPSMILMLHDDLTYRRIFMDGRPLESDPAPNWMGYSVGHWDGDALVVESAGFNDRTWLADRYPHTEALRLTERYRRTDFGHLDLEVTVEDPGAYAKPWKVRVSAVLGADTEMLEGYCDHTQIRQDHWVGKDSDDEKTAVKVAPDVLAKYAGVYKGFWARRPRVVDVTFSDGALFVAVDGRERQPFIAQSPTTFTANGLSYQIIRNGDGLATHMIETHVSGDYKYERQK